MEKELNFSKIILSVLLFICLLDMPYGYYQLVRFFSFIIFSCLAMQASNNQNANLVIIYATLACLFQPFLKISLGRELWNVIDIIVGCGLLLSFFNKKNQL